MSWMSIYLDSIDPNGSRLRRVILTEMAEVWSRRNTRRRLLGSARAIEAARAKTGIRLPAEVTDGLPLTIALRERALESDREHLRSLRRVFAALMDGVPDFRNAPPPTEG